MRETILGNSQRMFHLCRNKLYNALEIFIFHIVYRNQKFMIKVENLNLSIVFYISFVFCNFRNARKTTCVSSSNSNLIITRSCRRKARYCKATAALCSRRNDAWDSDECASKLQLPQNHSNRTAVDHNSPAGWS